MSITQPKAASVFRFDNSYHRLPEHFYARLAPTPVAAPALVKLNEALARELGLDPDHLRTPEAVAVFAGNAVPPDSDPLAMAYAGHQFGGFSPQLGDGRAILLGEIVDIHGQRRDIQLKGSGPTPFSRRGDGRAAIGPVLREYIVGEAMAALGIPTTRALAAVTTGEPVYRETVLPGAVLTRVAASHVRVGTFQYFAVRRDVDALRTLADYVIARHYPDAGDAQDPFGALLDGVIERQAGLVARWLLVGFIHGVMNTDNMSIAGETIDFGPCAFMDTYNPAQVYSSIDTQGRYAYGNQAQIAMWNLARFAETLLPLLAGDEARQLETANAAIARFPGLFQAAYLEGMRAKLGLNEVRDDDRQLIDDLLDTMAEGSADFTLAFRRLSHCAGDEAGADTFTSLFREPARATVWLDRWRARIATEPDPGRTTRMLATNPAYIARNHLVEEALAAATARGEYRLFDDLLRVVAAPFTERPGQERYALPPREDEIVRQTFCGT
ncbi:MAG: YdiU family protein [Hyphomicrobiaceae bacterium]